MSTEEKEKEKEDEQIVLSNKELHEKYLSAKKVSEEHLKRLALIDMDITRVEAFLQKSGFGEFYKNYKLDENLSFDLNFQGKKLLFGGINFLNSGVCLIDAKIKIRIEVYPFLPDFLESIASFHATLGVKHEDN